MTTATLEPMTIREVGLEKVRKVRRVCQYFPDDFDDVPVTIQRDIVMMLGGLADVLEAILDAGLDAVWELHVVQQMEDDQRYAHVSKPVDGNGLQLDYAFDAPPNDDEPLVEIEGA